MLSAICFNLDQSKILLSGNGLRRVAVSEHLTLKAGGLLIQVVSNTGLTVPQVTKCDSNIEIHL